MTWHETDGTERDVQATRESRFWVWRSDAGVWVTYDDGTSCCVWAGVA